MVLAVRFIIECDIHGPEKREKFPPTQSAPCELKISHRASIGSSVFLSRAEGVKSVDRSKFHLGDNASVAKIGKSKSSPVRLSRTSEKGQSAFGHFELVPSPAAERSSALFHFS